LRCPVLFCTFVLHFCFFTPRTAEQQHNRHRLRELAETAHEPFALNPNRNIFLVGMPGAGKTTIGKSLAKRLGLKFVDADKELVLRTGVPIATIFEIEGETGFRVREAEAIAELVTWKGIVLATGGGVVLHADSRRVLRESGAVVYLRASVADLHERTKRDSKRPLLRGPDPVGTLRTLLEARESLYTEVAHLSVESAHTTVGKLVDSIISQLRFSGLLDDEP
jgi:shikimate kinase